MQVAGRMVQGVNGVMKFTIMLCHRYLKAWSKRSIKRLLPVIKAVQLIQRKIKHSYCQSQKYMAVPLIQSLAKEVSMNIIRRLPTDINCLNGIHQVTHMLIGKGLRMAATALPSVASTSTAAPTATTPATLMASPPAYVSDIHANPIYRRKAVTRICV